MKNLSIFFILIFICNLSFAGYYDSAKIENEKSLKEYEALNESINAQKKELFERKKLAFAKLEKAKSRLESAKKEEMSLDKLTRTESDIQSKLDLILQALSKLDSNIFEVENSSLNLKKLLAFPEKYIPYDNMPEEIAEFDSGKTKGFPVDLSEGKIFKATQQSFIEKFKAGGVWVYPIAFFAIISLLTAFIKSIQLARVKRLKTDKIQHFANLVKNGDLQIAKKNAEQFGYPYQQMAVRLLQDSSLGSNLLEEESYETMLEVGDKLYGGLSLISITATIAPLLGLLGTVTGIIKTFSDLSIFGSGNANLLSGGISEALITTEFGLTLAIPAFVLYALLSRKAKAVLGDMERLASSFLTACAQRKK